jgi:LysM repeat protein
MNERARQIVRSTGAATALLVLVIAVPIALWRAVGNPLPAAIPAWNDIKRAVDGSQPVSDVFWIDLIAALVWIAWLRLTIGITLEIAATVRHRPQRLAAGRTQDWIAKTVATAALLLTLTHQRNVAPAPLPRLVAAVTVTPTPDTSQAAAPVPSTTTPAMHKTWTVQRHDSLWRIAERSLGDGRRYPEIYDLNRGRTQPDGNALVDPSVIKPGWILELPDDAITPTIGEATVTVAPGDTLSAIAQRTLGNANQWPALAATNAGVVQPDGQQLTDPNLIHPGWHISVPDPAADAETDQPRPSNDGVPRASVPTAPQTVPPVSAVPNSTETTPSNAAVSPTSTRLAARGHDLDPLRVAEWISLPSITAAILLLTVRRRRRTQLAYRAPESPISATSNETNFVERQVRVIADEDAVGWIDATTRLLTLAIRNDPTVRPLLVRTGTQGVEILLETPRPPHEPWFDSDDAGRTWRLQSRHDLDHLTHQVADEPAATPALVTIGTTPEGPLLANLERFGGLSVTGEPDRVQAFFNSITVELVNSPWCASIPVLVDDSLEAGQVEHAQPVAGASVGDLLRQHANATNTALPPSADTVAARTRQGASELWTPTVVLSGSPVETNALDHATPASGIIAVTTTPPSAAGRWRLIIDPDGSAHLQPLNFDIQIVAAISTDQLASVTALLADGPPAPDCGALVDEQPHEPAIDRGTRGSALNIEEVMAPKPVEVRVLGSTPVVEGWQAGEKVRAKSTEMIVRLALADQPLRTDRLWHDLWPHGCEYRTFKNAVARTRTMLGIDSTGERHLREAVEGTYRVGDEVGCDWDRFRTLVNAAGRVPDDEASEYLQAALSLVTGQPFRDIPKGDYGWAEVDGTVQAIEVAITDAAHRLGDLALTRGDAELASWAAAQGHLGTPEQLRLFETEILARGLAGDIDGVARAYNAAQHVVHRLEILDTVPTSIVDAYEKAMRTAHSERAAS